MNIAVLVKQVPDTADDRTIDAASGRIDRPAASSVIDEISERALEFALSCKDADPSTRVVLVSMGPADVAQSLRKALSMGADSAVHVVDDGLAGSDIAATARALAAALRTVEPDLVVAGNESTDGRGGVIPAMLAEHLGVPQLTFLTSAALEGHEVVGERTADGRTVRLRAALPAVISVTERFPAARFPSFKGIMAAKKKPLETLGIADLALGSADAARSTVASVVARPARSGGVTIVDDGDAARQLVEFLSTNRLI